MTQAKISRNYDDDKGRYRILILRKDNLLDHGTCVLFSLGSFFRILFTTAVTNYFFNFIFLTPKALCIEL